MFGRGLDVLIQLNKPSYTLGENLTFTAVVRSKKNTDFKSIKARLACVEEAEIMVEEYDYDEEDYVQDYRRETYTHYSQELVLAGAGNLYANYPLTIRGAFKIPENAPPTYAGKVSKVNWVLEVKVDRGFLKSKTAKVTIPVYAKPYIPQQTQPIKVEQKFSEALMILYLNSLIVPRGGWVTGRLDLYPQTSFKFTEIRAEVATVEKTYMMEEVTLVSGGENRIAGTTVKLLNGGEAYPGYPISVPLNLRIDPTIPQTFHGRFSRVETFLKIVVARRFKSDLVLTRELKVV